MTKEKYSEAQNLKSKIQGMESGLSLIKFTYTQKFPPHFRIQGATNNVLIENEELNKKIELIVVEFMKKEIEKLQKEFEEL